MQRARCYLIGETAVVLELEPPVTLASQKRIDLIIYAICCLIA